MRAELAKIWLARIRRNCAHTAFALGLEAAATTHTPCQG